MEFFITALLIVSVITNLTVEGIKKLLDGIKVKYSSNILAAITAVVIALIIGVVNIILNEIQVSSKVVIEILILMYLSFLTSTVGYDKVIQTFTQIRKKE